MNGTGKPHIPSHISEVVVSSFLSLSYYLILVLINL
jgi:hypothetical protein